MSLLDIMGGIAWAPIVAPAFGLNLYGNQVKSTPQRPVQKIRVLNQRSDSINIKLDDLVIRGSKEWYELPIEKQAKLSGCKNINQFKYEQIHNLHWADEMYYKNNPNKIPSYLRNHQKLK